HTLAGDDLLGDRVAPGQVWIAPRLDRVGPPADGVRPDLGEPPVGARLAGSHPGERPHLAVRSAPDHVAAELVVTLAVADRGHGHKLAHNRLRWVASTRDRRRDIFDGESSGHRSPR